MFKKLKDKIAEEVKQSPLKSVQQLAQAVVSPSSSSVFEPSSSNDKFCIEEGDIEEDEKQEQAKPGGFTSVTLTGQTTSPIRDQNQKYGFRSSGSLSAEADNLFPKFEPQPTNFHVQSDWESASEVEDRYSQLEHINKESLYEAYRKVYNRYNRIKNKYHEVVTHYRQLEREKEKAKTVLTETQDKALLRISELREQCLLEQQAKAHLEEALRNELEERDHIINTLKTKVQYLKGVSDSSTSENLEASHLSKEEENLIDFTENSSVSTVPLPFDASSCEEKINWFEGKLKNLQTLLNEETSKIEHLRSKLKEVKKQSYDLEDTNLENMDNSESFVSEEKTKLGLNITLSELIAKLALEVQYLQKNAVHCSLIKPVNDKANAEIKLTESGDEKFPGSKNIFGGQKDEIVKYTDAIRRLEEENKALIQRLQEEISTAKELKNELNSLSTITDVLKKKIKLSNENFGKNDAINCLIIDVENELIREWNLCFQNFLQTRCEITVLKDTRDDLEKELLRVKEERNKSENITKEITEKNSKLKGDVEDLQKDLKNYLAQLETLSRERSDFRVRNENLERQIKTLEETLKHSEKASNEKQGDVMKIIDEKKAAETKLASLESEYSLLLEEKQKLDVEVSSLRNEVSDVITEKEALNNKINEMENKLKQVEDDHKTLLNDRDGLDNQINSLTKEAEELFSEKSILLSKISKLETYLENNKQQTSFLLEEKDKLLEEIRCIKDEYEIINREKLSITDKFHDLVNEFENNKQEYSKYLESAKQQSDELHSLRKERDELIIGKGVLELKIEGMNGELEKLKDNCTEAIKIKGSLSKELFSVQEERDKLTSEIQSIQNRIVELNSVSKAANEELSAMKKEYADLTTEKINMQNEIEQLEERLKSNIENYSSSSDVNMKLSEELCYLKKEKDDLIIEKNNIEIRASKLEDELTFNKEELSKFRAEYQNISYKLQVLQKDHEDLILEKQTAKDTLEKIKNDLKEKEEMLSSVNEKNNKLCDEIEKLKSEYGQTDDEYKSLQGRYNSVIADFENNKDLIASLTEMKKKLSEEVDSLKKDCESANGILSQTQSQLQKEKDTNSELEDKWNSLSESLKEKHVETNNKCKENVRLETEIEKFREKINVLNCCIEKLTKEKDFLLNYLTANLNNVKIIKELQANLYDYVKQFQTEISHDIKDINLKMGHDLTKQLNDLLDPETQRTKVIEIECKRKKDIDSYNAKLKNLQGLPNIAEEVLQVKATDLENSNSVENELNSKVVKFRRMGQLEKSAELDDCILYDQDIYDPEAYLKKAISLMKSFTNLLNHNSGSSDYSVDIFTPNSEKYIRLNEIEGKNLQREIVAMESFIIDCEAKYKEIGFHKLNKSDDIDDHDKMIDMQLRQEIRLKDDIIKKLQSVIEEYEQKKDSEDSLFAYEQKVQVLEQENRSLTEKLQQIKETHELNMKNVISEYEKKLEEIEEEKNFYDFENMGKENKYVINEMKEQIQNLQQDLEERGDAFEKLYEEHHQSVKSLEEEIHQLRSNHDKELREQDKKWRQCLDRRLAEEETRHQQELTSLNMQWNAERRELETARRLAVNAVESGSGSNELLRRQVQALTVQLTEMRNNRCEACDHKRKNEVGQDHRPRSIQDCTEMEYLRNILYEYMMGKEPLVLAKVLCALVKFDENQTKEVVSKEEHRITLFGQLGLL